MLYSVPVVLVGAVLFVLLLLNLVLLPKRRQSKDLHDELLTHAVVTGGSSGIGLSIAKDIVKKECQYVTLIARTKQTLEEAKNMLEEYATSIGSPTIIKIISVDISDANKIKEEAEKLSKSEVPNVTMLFNVAGTSTSASFLDTDYEEFGRLMNINYLGTAYATKAFLPHMKTGRKAPRAIVFTSSQAGQVGVYGFTAYAASKSALRGFAEALHMEIARDNITVQVAYPPDTDTPGYKDEQIGKPEETRLISETSGLFQPEKVAESIVASALKPRPPFMIYFGLEGWMLATLTAGMCPLQTNVNALCQIFLMGLLRFVSLFYLMDFRRIVEKIGKKNK